MNHYPDYLPARRAVIGAAARRRANIFDDAGTRIIERHAGAGTFPGPDYGATVLAYAASCSAGYVRFGRVTVAR